MTELFHKFQSRQFQFALELMARFRHCGEVSRQSAEQIAREYGLEYADQCIPWLLKAGLITESGTGYRLADGIQPAELPPGKLEKEFLAGALKDDAAPLFLELELRALLEEAILPQEEKTEFQSYTSAAPAPAPGLPGEEFRALLQAIQEGREVIYRYTTATDSGPREGTAIPWKLEYDAFDHRWWVILYIPEQDRTVKAVLDHLRDIRLGGAAHASEEKILRSMERLLAPEPIVLEIRTERSALERCALVFQHQMLQTMERMENGNYKLMFPYYRFDENEILHKLLYLGPMVRLRGPKQMQRKLMELLDTALANTEDSMDEGTKGGQI